MANLLLFHQFITITYDKLVYSLKKTHILLFKKKHKFFKNVVFHTAPALDVVWMDQGALEKDVNEKNGTQKAWKGGQH